jgi:hypothetical protein
MWETAVIVMVLSHHLPEGTEEYHKKHDRTASLKVKN